MYWLSKRKYIILLLLPVLCVYFVYICAPIAVAVGYSFTNYNGIGKAAYVGLHNYIRLFKDNIFYISLKNTFIIFIGSFVSLVIGGFAVALLLNTQLRYSALAKAFIFAPAVIAPIIVGIIWVFIFDPKTGFINSFLQLIGLGSQTRLWIGGKTLTPFCVTIIYCWQQLGYLATIYIAGLKQIPKELFEAAEIDGANGWNRLRFITVPMMRNSISTVAILVITGTFKIFEVVQQLTNGGPNHMSETLITYGYAKTFSNGEYGYGMTLSTVTFFLSLLITFIYSSITRNRER
ncbi:MAG: sugar ABC transporter permease [Treponema sp.]|jgi:multiple sugar transport system permease protein/raffinose/stachyose/melibiose transport system permease protein|nr:sugar ABC transporter permease [Treponema sp.]